MTKKTTKLLKGPDGFFIGSVNKNGELAKGSYKPSDTEIAILFEDYLRRYCERNNTNILLAYRKGRLQYECLLHNEDGTVGSQSPEKEE